MATESLVLMHDVPVLDCPVEGPSVDSDAAALDLIGAALGHDAQWVLVPVERFPPEFFTLSTRLAGEITQKFVNYRLRLAIVGDMSTHAAKSAALRDFVGEANRGGQLWFVASREEFAERLARRPGRPG